MQGHRKILKCPSYILLFIFKHLYSLDCDTKDSLGSFRTVLIMWDSEI